MDDEKLIDGDEEGYVMPMLRGMGRYVLFCSGICAQFRKVSVRSVIQQMEFVGNRSGLIIVMAAMMVGGVFGIQFGQIFRIFGTESLIGGAAAFALSKELAPMVGAFLVTGRAGSAMAAEIATMRINEQIDALRTMAIEPVGFLVVPRVLAASLLMPLLSGIFLVVGVLAAFALGVLLFQVDVGVFFDNIVWLTRPNYVWQGLQKSMAFGFIFSSVACYYGFYASGGAKGVGQAATRAVVTSLVAILLTDFLISYVQLHFF